MCALRQPRRIHQELVRAIVCAHTGMCTIGERERAGGRRVMGRETEIGREIVHCISCSKWLLLNHTNVLYVNIL